jgi:hypothetical protein
VTGPDIAPIATPRQAAVLFQHPLRLRILALAEEPVSATGIAQSLQAPRQKVNYHVRTLARAGLLRKAGQRRRRNLVEQRYQASSRAFVLAPGLLGALGAHTRPPRDAMSAGALVALLAKAQDEVARGMDAGEATGRRQATLSMASDFRFESADERQAFAEALSEAVVSVIDRFTSPATTGAGTPAPGVLHRLVLACYSLQESSP